MKMKPLSLAKIAEITGGKLIGDSKCADILITGVEKDNRLISEGELFVCIRGERFDGHNFASAALASGASACLCEREVDCEPYILVDSTLSALKKIAAYYRGLFDIPFIGVTGSVGKTTAKEMIAAVLGEKYSVLKTPENLNNEIGVPLTLLSLREEHTAAVIEMGISDFGEMSRLAEMVRPDICLTTTIGYCHLENLGDLEGVLRAKSEVFAFMPRTGLAVVSGDSELLRAYDPGIEKITFGLGEHNDYRAENIAVRGFDGIKCDIVTPENTFSAFIPAFGIHMALGALPAVIIGRRLGLSDGDIAAGLAKYEAVGGRANIIRSEKYTVINDCYNANPNSVSASLSSLSGVPGRKVAVLGDMGELGRDEAKLHYSIGEKAASLGIDLLITGGALSENTSRGYTENGGAKAVHYADKKELIASLGSLLSAGDTVLVKASHSQKFEEIVTALTDKSK